MTYINEIKAGEVSDLTHKLFIRFGKGTFIKEQIEIKKTSKKITIYCGLLDSYDLFETMTLIAKPDELFELSGIVQTSKCPESFKEVIFEKQPRKKNIVKGKVYGKDLKEFFDKVSHAFPLFQMKSKNITFSTKKSLPKVNKLVERFAKLIIPVEFEDVIKKQYDLKKVENMQIKNTFEITDLVHDKDLPLELVREHAKRSGKIIREITYQDGTTEK
jgi:hypothetical protein